MPRLGSFGNESRRCLEPSSRPIDSKESNQRYYRQDIEILEESFVVCFRLEIGI